MTAIPDYGPMLRERLSLQRRALAESSPAMFAHIYLSHHFTRPPSRMHTEILTLLADATQRRPRRLAIAAPRGHAKTTVVSLGYVLWSILFKREMFVLLVSAAGEQAIGLLKTIKTELTTNPLLLEDFPEACVPAEKRRLVKPWKDAQIVLPNGTCVRALGAEQRMRGMKHNQHRPGLIVCDDLEDQEQTASADQRAKLRTWFEGTLLKMSEPSTNVVVVGTILHYDSLLANLIGLRTSLTQTGVGEGKVSGWEGRIYQAVEAPSERPELWEKWESIYSGREELNGRTGPEAAGTLLAANRPAMMLGTKVLWPELEGYEQLMILRVREGRASFQAEKQNEPVDPDQCLFREDRIQCWDDAYAGDPARLLAALGSNARIYGACDPSLGRKGGRGDFSAIVTVVEDKTTKTVYVLAADIALRTPDQTIQKIIQYAGMYRYREFAVETNGFQEMLVNQLKDAVRNAGLSLSIKEVKNSSDKIGRIQTMEPLVAQGILKFSRRHGILLEQLRQFPLAAHDDGPDALEMAVQLARKPRHRVQTRDAFSGQIIADSDWH